MRRRLLRAVAARGFTPSLTFHPGTQCADPRAWGAYIGAAAQVARAAGVRLARLNVGGGFASHRTGRGPRSGAIFDHIGTQVARHFPEDPPALVCEPGRAMVAEAVSLGLRVKALRGCGAVFLNDGVYGGLTEIRDIGAPDRIRVIAPDGTERRGAPVGALSLAPPATASTGCPTRCRCPVTWRRATMC